MKHSAKMTVVCFQGWQYSAVRSEFVYYVPRTFNFTTPAYHTSVQFLTRTVPTYRTQVRYVYLHIVSSINLIKQ